MLEREEALFSFKAEQGTGSMRVHHQRLDAEVSSRFSTTCFEFGRMVSFWNSGRFVWLGNDSSSVHIGSLELSYSACREPARLSFEGMLKS